MTPLTPADVRILIPATTLSDAAIQSFIDDATVMVGPCTMGIDCTTAKVIIKYVTAHLIASLGGSPGGSKALTQRALGDASESYASAVMGSNLAGTSFGQQALMLDSTGCLANLGKRRGFAKLL